jgi:hypothetical protein
LGEYLSLRQLGRLLKRDPSGLGRALKKLGVSTTSDGKFDKDEVLIALGPKISAAPVDGVDNQRESTPRGLHPPRSKVTTIEDAKLAVTLVKQVLREEGSVASVVDLEAARTAETILKARERWLKIEATSGRLVDREAVEREIFALARADRDRLMNWPSQIGPLLANELGVADIPKVIIGLEKYVRQHLKECSENVFEQSTKAGLERATRASNGAI